MHNWEPDIKFEKGWIEALENYSVFFSYPLDFDFMMLRAFPDSYKRPSNGGLGPNIPIDVSKDDYKALRNAYAAIIKKTSECVTRDMSKLKNAELYFWYRYLFLGRSKPVSHLRMIAEIEEKELVVKCPVILKKLLTKIQADIL